MSEKIRTYDSNTRRKVNKQYHQLEKNILEKNHFSYIGIVQELNQGEGKFKDRWCKVKIVPTIAFKEFDRETGFTPTVKEKNEIATAFIPKDMPIALGDIVLVVFTDVNFKNAMLDILKGYNKDNTFIEKDITQHSINFGVITNRLWWE